MSTASARNRALSLEWRELGRVTSYNRRRAPETGAAEGAGRETGTDVRTLRVLLLLIVLGFVALAGYAYWPGNLTPQQGRIVKPVTLDADG